MGVAARDGIFHISLNYVRYMGGKDTFLCFPKHSEHVCKLVKKNYLQLICTCLNYKICTKVGVHKAFNQTLLVFISDRKSHDYRMVSQMWGSC